MLNLKNVTLFGIDTIDAERLHKAAKVCTSYVEFGAVCTLTNKDFNINSIEDYSRFMIKDLHKYIHTDHVLIFQYDGFILNADGWKDEFLEYDYIGAPWVKNQFTNSIGNGGFSLRSKRLLEEVSKITSMYHPEDLCICNLNYDILVEKGFKFAPYELGCEFAFESNYERGKKWNGQFGFHDLRITDISNWSDKDKFKY